MKYLDKITVIIRRQRRKLDLTQDEIAARMDMDRGYYAQLENGKYDMKISTLSRVAEALETEAWKILKDAANL